MKRRRTNWLVPAFFSIAGMLSILLVLSLAAKPGMFSPPVVEKSKPKETRPRLKPQLEPPDPPLKPLPVPDHSDAYRRELKDVQFRIETTKERLAVLRKRSDARAATGMGAVGVAEAVAEVRRGEADREEYERLAKNLASLFDREAELESLIRTAPPSSPPSP